MNLLLTIFFFILIIGVLVLVHELGHFLAAKLSHIGVNEFAIGFGKILISKKFKGTLYTIRMIPLGGFVDLEGEHSNAGPHSFRTKPIASKTFVLMAGVFMNLLFAVILLTLFLASNGYKFPYPNLASYEFTNAESQKAYTPVTITQVDPEGRSHEQLEVGESIVELKGESFSSFDDFSQKLKDVQNQTVEVTFIDLDTFDSYKKMITLGGANEDGVILDVSLITETPAYFVKYNKTLTSGVSMTYDIFVYQLKVLGHLIGDSFSTGNFTQLSQSVGGLPAVTSQIQQAVDYQAIDYLIPLTGFISISLALFNALPLPALDGGQLVIAIFESVTRKRVPDELLSKINLGGFIFLIGLSILINLKDVIQLGWAASLGDFVKNVLGR